jgi:hypothetical protein
MVDNLSVGYLPWRKEAFVSEVRPAEQNSFFGAVKKKKKKTEREEEKKRRRRAPIK